MAVGTGSGSGNGPEDVGRQDAAVGTGTSEGEPTAERGESGDVSAESDEGDEGGERRRGSGGSRSFWKELPLLIGIALVLALLIKTFLLQAFSIPSNSMQDTLQVGDRVLVDKLTPWFGGEPERGEVVVFHDPGGWLPDTQVDRNIVQQGLSAIGLMPSADEKDLIKRVIGVGGDTVECRRGGPVKVNGEALDEPYLKPGSTPCDDNPFGPLTVPEDHMWVMGDNRQHSLDSRYHEKTDGGMVPVEQAVGRAVVIAWPPGRWGTLPVPDTFGQEGLAAAASGAGPAALGLAGAVPLVLWRRRRLAARESITG
ncbi:signal peptidase I [Streptomyces sp. JJ36]|uniref:signal peptidase I n=1 Tax=Streptomyces sp. JJ36 TaxID=2736645 RepID=UPI001F01846F|nr:signal peptidase I [Streptomyces sp. JJ36]MCF6523277.1 signal peptidase I [Streptomyces sp. JJ36]